MEKTLEPQDLSPGLISGRLEGISVPDLMWALCRERRTGVLHLSRGGVDKTVFIQDGRIVFASSSDPDDRLGELLLRIGMVRLDQLEEVLKKLGSGKRLGTLLVEAGHLSPDSLVEGVLTQVQEIVLGLYSWESGEYRFDEGELPTQEVITLGMRTGEILMKGIRRIRSFSRIRRSVGPLRTVFRLSENWRSCLEGLELTEGEDLLLDRLQSGASIEALCEEVFLSNFEIYQTLWAFKVLGVVHEVEATQGTSPDASLEGLIDENGISPILVNLCRSRETGVLYLSHGSQERTFHIQEGSCVFATSNDIEDGLIAYLLRRGVISLRDREETAKRLLSNKRVGTILRQLGVIDDEDLRTLVREQLSEIVFDTFRWQSGEFSFVSGPLPSIEEITLEASLESLVSAGQRRVSSWTRIREGCGGLDTPLRLTPDYMDVLDRMNVGTEEWEVVSYLRNPCTARQICGDARLPDYVICQVLWALRTLGAVEEADDVAAMAEAPDEQAVVAHDAQPVDGVDEAEMSPDPETDAEAASELQSDGAVDPGTADPGTADPGAADPGAADPGAFDFAVDSPGDSTMYIPREQVEAALRGMEERAQAEAAANTETAEDEVVEASVSADAAPTADPVEEPAETEESTLTPATPSTPWEEQAVEAESYETVWEDSEEDDAEGAPPPEPEWVAQPEVAATSDTQEGSEARPGEDSTSEIPRREVEEALAEEASAEEAVVEEVDAGPPFEPQGDLDLQIARLNARQKIVYRTIRSEIGAGAANFVRSCTSQLDTIDPFEGAELRSDGSWDAESLRRVAVERRLEDVGNEYDRLIEVEIESLRDHIGEARASSLRRQVERAESGATFA